MRQQNQSSRSRYKTPLPFAAEVAHYEWKRDQSTNRHDDDLAKLDKTQSAARPPLMTVSSYGTTSSTSSTMGHQAVIMADSDLPYQRILRTDLTKMAAELDLADFSSTSSSERNLTQEITPPTELSNGSNNKLSSPGYSTDRTTPEEPLQHKADLRPQPLFASPASQMRRRSTASIRQDAQARSPIQILDDSPPHPARGLPQRKGRARSISSKTGQHDFQTPVTSEESQPSTSLRRTSPEEFGPGQTRSSKSNIPQYGPYRQLATNQIESPERGRNATERTLHQIPTRLSRQSDAKAFSQQEPTIPSRQHRLSQSMASHAQGRRISDASTQSRIVLDDTSHQPLKSEIGRSRASPRLPPNNFPDNHKPIPLPVSEPSIVTRRRSQSATPIQLPTFIGLEPALQGLENPELNGQSVPALRRQNSRPNHVVVSSKRQPRAQSAWRPPSVWYENVDGVTLSTRPKSAKESRGGLSIPEIEAQDIREIPEVRGCAQGQTELDFECRFADRDVDYAASPPAIGTDLSQTRSISPRPARESRDHIFFDTYSRAAADEMPNQRANPPRARRSESVSRMNVSVPEIIREMPIAESESFSLDNADDGSISDSEAAIPPDVARSRSPEEQDFNAISRTGQVKSLLGGMMKGLAGKNRKDEYKYNNNDESAPTYTSLADDPTKADRGDVFFLDSGDDADSMDSRPTTVIWSPPKGRGRYSEDMTYARRVSYMSDGSSNHFRGQVSGHSGFASLGGLR